MLPTPIVAATVAKPSMLPTPFIHLATPATVADQLELGGFSAHVYIAYEHGVLMLHSLKYGNVMGPGGKLNPDETVLAGLTRELNEEIPVLTDFILAQLRDRKAVGMWRQTKAGVHHTFLIEATPSDFDVWSKRAELQAVIEREKATSNRPDYLEADGGLVFVPLEPMIKTLSDWKHSNSTAEPKIECYIDAMERNILPLRGVIVPVMEELKTLLRLLKSDMRVREAYTKVNVFYQHFADNEMITLDGYPTSRDCVTCDKNRAILDDFYRSQYAITCNDCGHKHATAIRELRRVNDAGLCGADVLVLACRPVEHYEAQ